MTEEDERKLYSHMTLIKSQIDDADSEGFNMHYPDISIDGAEYNFLKLFRSLDKQYGRKKRPAPKGPQLCGHDDSSWCNQDCEEKERIFREHHGLPAMSNV
jgi:hypothetical protein